MWFALLSFKFFHSRVKNAGRGVCLLPLLLEVESVVEVR